VTEAVVRDPLMGSGPVRAALAGSGVTGDELLELITRLFAIDRSLTGEGVRRTLAILAETLPVEVTEVPSGTHVYDWVVPPEWHVRRAWIADPTGRRLVDFDDNHLHVLAYSAPVRAQVSGAELLERLHWLPDTPELIPFRTTYFARNWGFCVTGAQRAAIDPAEEYEVVIDSSLDEGGSMTYGEVVVPGRSEQRVLLSTYVCHPALANEISGIATLAALASALQDADLRFTYHFLFAPATIGALTWLLRNEVRLPLVRHGLIVSCAGDRGGLTYKQSRRGKAEVDRAARHVVERRPGGSIQEFEPWGGDERQFCSPGFDLPMGSLTRSRPARYPEYHTSADDLSVLEATQLADTLDAVAETLDILEQDAVLESLNLMGEPQLGHRGLYETIGTGLPFELSERRRALLWILNSADGQQSLLDLAERTGLPFRALRTMFDVLEEEKLVRGVET
jgi:aminopeptidase-like protein